MIPFIFGFHKTNISRFPQPFRPLHHHLDFRRVGPSILSNLNPLSHLISHATYITNTRQSGISGHDSGITQNRKYMVINDLIKKMPDLDFFARFGHYMGQPNAHDHRTGFRGLNHARLFRSLFARLLTTFATLI